ncbi:MAG: type II toxin-antitoxin system RelE/ParE family toxin [Ilumatobacteraceae bacterium]
MTPWREATSTTRGRGTKRNNPVLGDRFAAALDHVVLQAARWPRSGSPTMLVNADEVVERRIAAPGFPYTVRYRVIEDSVVVMAVAHQHRRPGFAADRRP